MMRANGKIRSLYLYTLQCENTFAREMQMEMESICGICVLSFHQLSIFGIGIDSIILKRDNLRLKRRRCKFRFLINKRQSTTTSNSFRTWRKHLLYHNPNTFNCRQQNTTNNRLSCSSTRSSSCR